MKLTLYIVSEHQQGLMRLIEHWRGLWRNKEVDSEVEPPLGADEDPFDEPVVMEIRDVIDLHAIPPKQVKAVVEEYLIEARARRFSYVRIIHGKGIGAQRAMVRKILDRAPFVIGYYDAPPEAGGLGATIAELDIEKHG
jgi:dsDNA-specific endonuclease/ATPase MutS2